jgi:serine/threonine protein kinase
VKDVELGADVEFPFFTMDYVEGGRSLRDLIDHGERFTEPDLAATCRILSELVYPGKSGSERNLATTKHQFQSRSRLFAGIVCHVAKAIHDLHQGGNGYLHCELKPGNILISKKNGPLIGDLGLSRAMKGGYTNKESFTGTPAYSSPEQAAGNALTVQSDVYQLGAVLFRCLTGRAPFHRNSKGESDLSLLQRVQTEDIVPPSQINREVDRDLEAICMKALSKLPAQRYSSAGDMTADLLRYLKGEPVHARPGFRRREIIRTCLRSVWSYLFIGLVLSGLIGWSAYNNYQHEAFLNHQEVDGCVASTNRYRALDLVPPPQIEVLPIRDHRSAACLVGVLASPSGSSSLQAASLLGSGLLEGWPNPDYSHVIIKSSSAYFDLSRWKPIPPGTSPATADRSQGEPALYTRVIDLERKVSVSQERPKVSFQLRTEGYDVDLKCVTHPYRILGSPAREPLGGGVKPVLIREVEVDLSAVPNGELTRVVIHGTIWNGFQRTPPPLHCAVALLMPLPWAVFANAIVADDSRQWAAFLAPDALSEGELAVKFPRNLKPRQSPKLFFFKKGSPKQEEPIGTQNFHDPRDKDWWVWRPRDIRRDHVYQIEWSWKPTPSP